MAIRWAKCELAEPTFDLSTRVNGVWADIVGSVDGHWYCLWNTVQRFGPFVSRDAALAWFDLAVVNLRKGRTPVVAVA